MPLRGGYGGFPCSCSESGGGGANHLRDHGNHRHLGLRRCDPNVGIVWSRSVHQGIDMDRCMIASI
jgi:hypothetical protein